MKGRAQVEERIELGCAGHLIVSDNCRFHRHTQIRNDYRVSTVGDYYPVHASGDRETIGGNDDDFFETMVFKTTSKPAADNDGCGCHEIKSWGEVDSERYATTGEAQAGHEKYVQKYLISP